MGYRPAFHWQLLVGAAVSELEDLGGVMKMSTEDGLTQLSGNMTSRQLIVLLKVLDERGIRVIGLARRGPERPAAVTVRATRRRHQP